MLALRTQAAEENSLPRVLAEPRDGVRRLRTKRATTTRASCPATASRAPTTRAAPLVSGSDGKRRCRACVVDEAAPTTLAQALQPDVLKQIESSSRGNHFASIFGDRLKRIRELAAETPEAAAHSLQGLHTAQAVESRLHFVKTSEDEKEFRASRKVCKTVRAAVVARARRHGVRAREFIRGRLFNDEGRARASFMIASWSRCRSGTI